eukprot:COSAG05_NODE_1180_length_5597_cov_2.237541_5_plen_136_part_00
MALKIVVGLALDCLPNPLIVIITDLAKTRERRPQIPVGITVSLSRSGCLLLVQGHQPGVHRLLLLALVVLRPRRPRAHYCLDPCRRLDAFLLTGPVEIDPHETVRSADKSQARIAWNETNFQVSSLSIWFNRTFS